MEERVLGIETEYAVIYHPSRAERADGSRPSNFEVFQLFDPLLARRLPGLPRAASLLRSKPGRMLVNGGSFHYEAVPQHFEHGLIEMASPECRDPFTLLAHERAQDELVEEVCSDVNARLRARGYGGEVRLGKNNVDSAGHTFGSHESYWVDDPLSLRRRLLLAPVWAATWLATLPVLAWLVAVNLALVLAGLGVAVAPLLAPPLRALARRIEPRRPATAVRMRGQALRLAGAPGRLAARLQSDPGALIRRLAWVELPFRPVVALHSAVYNVFHFEPLRRALPAFLVTRTLYAGAGRVAFDGGPLVRTAQRPPFLRSLARMFTSGDDRPLIETRDLFFRPWSAFGRHRRLHLLCGDANLCDQALVLRTGTTALVLEAIEAAPGRRWPELSAPLAAFREVARDPALGAELKLVGGGSARALAIQRAYRRGVEEVLGAALARLPAGHWKRRVLAAWDETLELLASNPGALADRVDWLAKAALLAREAPDVADRQALESGGAALLRAGGGGGDPRLHQLAYRLLRTDLRYHELSPRGGHRRLRERGRVRALVDAAAIARAREEPPPDTRAHARGQAIREALRAGGSGGATWHRVRVARSAWHLLPDPLAPEPAWVLRLPDSAAFWKRGGPH